MFEIIPHSRSSGHFGFIPKDSTVSWLGGARCTGQSHEDGNAATCIVSLTILGSPVENAVIR
jgi:hypothetical protein